jgi:hypothetical protein
MAWKVWPNNSAPCRGATAQRAHFMNISINITYTSGTKVELVVPLEEPCKIASEPQPESQPKKPGNCFDVMKHCDELSASQGKATGAPDPVQPAQDLADAMWQYNTAPAFPSNAALEGQTRNMYNMTFQTQDGKDWTVPAGLMKDLVIIYGEKTVEQELLKAHAWLEADPKRRKTPRGMGRYLNGWLSRASSMVRTPIKTLLKRDTSLLATNGSTQESW